MSTPAIPQIRGKRPLRRLLRPLYRALLRLEIHGLDRIPEHGPCLFVFNHLSNLDAHLFFILVPRDDATGLVASEYRSRALERRLVEWGGGIWLRRGEADRAALKRALTLLASGWLVGLAPEGGRSPDGRLQEGRRGAAMLALRSGAPVLPVGLVGTREALASWAHLKRPRVQVFVGNPRRYSRAPGAAFRSETFRVTTEIMQSIAELLPREIRGAYARPPCVGGRL